MRRTAVVAAVALVGVATAGRPTPAPQPPAPAGVVLVPELDALNALARAAYKDRRQAVQDGFGPVILVGGDELILRRGKDRSAVTVIPAGYHALKCVSHVPLGIYPLLAGHTDLSPAVADRVKAYRQAVRAAWENMGKCGFDADTLARQTRLLAAGGTFLDGVLAANKVDADALTAYCRASRADVTANAAAAARLQLTAVHDQVQRWRKEVPPAEWADLRVVVQGTQLPRANNAAVQYFCRLLNEPGEGGRVVYAESLWDEDKAVALAATRALDGAVGRVFFADPTRLYADLLADPARAVIDDLFTGK